MFVWLILQNKFELTKHLLKSADTVSVNKQLLHATFVMFSNAGVGIAAADIQHHWILRDSMSNTDWNQRFQWHCNTSNHPTHFYVSRKYVLTCILVNEPIIRPIQWLTESRFHPHSSHLFVKTIMKSAANNRYLPKLCQSASNKRCFSKKVCVTTSATDCSGAPRHSSVLESQTHLSRNKKVCSKECRHPRPFRVGNSSQLVWRKFRFL